ncbi:Transaldolase [Acaryochloris thomasi RCC1774]|uniref:Transaldolase n=1 Tax=Acaryochloris thomasi RCC1774 TaxID=1764569 RepID=A0A2W1JQ97_9CYAN|nr:transaldolase family protein [Acaryochloris thomasi]PZD72304.1 Transaldolase [Acaryochloris thomasi RCC1774]
MHLFLDTADQSQWHRWLPLGVFDGITTNPTLLERSQVPCTLESLKSLAQSGFDLGVQEIQMQTWGREPETLYKNGHALAKISDRIVVKVPITQAGCTAAARLIVDGIRVTMTGVYARHQVLLATSLGAEYAAPYLGRITDSGRNGRDDLAQMQQALDGVGSDMKLLVASIRAVEDIVFLARQGLDTFTVGDAIATQLFDVDATLQAAETFEKAADQMRQPRA